jgi:AAA15 family ATPase/GTPase
MPRYFLTRVKIEGFRGINNDSEPLELKFRPNAVNSVFAANGIGKSSIYEALNYAIRGVVPKLEVFKLRNVLTNISRTAFIRRE